MWTAPQQRLLLELNLLPKPDQREIKKSGATKADHSKQFPQRSGNLETPLTNPQHRKLMGQSDNPHGTRADKVGRPQAKGIRAEPNKAGKPEEMEDPTGLKNLGQPFDRGLVEPLVGDDAEISKNDEKHKPQRMQGPSETPGRQTWTSFGNRYPGGRNP